LYPPINLAAVHSRSAVAPGLPVTVLSINRFERKKNISLALQAFAHLRARADLPERLRGEGALRLVIAGGYDPRVSENVEYLAELRKLSDDLRLPPSAISFRTSISDEEKIALLKECTVVVYTPSNEHFGIVPIEAMYMQRPVVACSSGGPLETVRDGETGFLSPPEPSQFSRALFELVSDPERAAAMGKRASAIVEQKFLLSAFAAQLESYLLEN
ncbi:MAG TPA: glycosyltransferase, partial [archaeon]|nr:glycosyltransferase [archaeon]